MFADDFECANGKYVPSSYECDTDDDCGDYSDETNCCKYHKILYLKAKPI